MAVHVVLNRDEVRSILSLYRLEALEDFGGISEGSLNTSYWVLVSGRRYFLRITERKRVQDMIFERELLELLNRSGLSVPRLIENVAKGTFTPWSVRGRFVSLFEYMEGRSLGIFEIRPHHVSEVARFAANMHQIARPFRRNRSTEHDLSSTERRLERLQTALNNNRLAARYAADIHLLAGEIQQQSQRTFEGLPRGPVHGDLLVDNVKFKEDKLSGVIDFEFASTARYTWELAIGINAWCWEPATSQRGGPAGHFAPSKTCAFLQSYAEIRSMSPEEQSALSHDLRLVAARLAITRLCDFEMKKQMSDRRAYRDYRHYLERLRALQNGGAEAIIASAGLNPSQA